MALADLGRLTAAHDATAQALARRLPEVGFGRDYVQALSSQLPGLPPQLHPTGLNWLTLEDPAPAALALRLLVLHRELSAAQLDTLFGAALAADLQQAGLLLPEEANWYFPFHLELVNQLMIVCDPQADDFDTVMAVGGSTQLLAAACYPQADVDRALDLGCGSGTLALLMAAACREVVGVDINPRALQLARFNAALNGVHNVQWRLGNLFEPVASERFDLIVSQPPFLPKHDQAPQVLYLHGGARGDELVLALVAQLPAHLTAEGVAIVLSDFPVHDQEPLAQRLRAAIPAMGLTLLHAEHATAAATRVTLYHGALNAHAARESLALHRHLQALGVAEILQAVVVVHPGEGTMTVSIEDRLWGGLRRSDIDKLLLDRQQMQAERAAAGETS